MKKEELGKYVVGLSPELQEKARECKDMQELNAFLAENDVELSEDALSAVAGGCSKSSDEYNQGDPVTKWKKALCPLCGQQLYYWDMCHNEKGCLNITRMYCSNPSCSSYNNGLWYACAWGCGYLDSASEIKKY